MITRDISSANIVRVLKDIFARFGLPEEIVSDNGPQFVSKEFETFLNKNGIRHVRSSPYHPQSNGKIERFHCYLKKHFRAAVSEGKSWEDELPSILMAYRSTCHPMTGASPDVMLFKREIRTKLPSVNVKNFKEVKNVEKSVSMYKKRMKAYYDRKKRVKPHGFELGDIVYCAQLQQKSKLTPTFISEKCVIIEFHGKDTCSVVNTITGRIVKRNVKYIRHASLRSKVIYDDDMDNAQVEIIKGNSETSDIVRNELSEKKQLQGLVVL